MIGGELRNLIFFNINQNESKIKNLHQTERLFLLNILFWEKSWISL